MPGDSKTTRVWARDPYTGTWNWKAQKLMADSKTTNFYPQTGAVYRHHKGGLYQVLMVVRREGDAADMVVYRPQDGTIPWVRPLIEFGEKFSYVSNVGWER